MEFLVSSVPIGQVVVFVLLLCRINSADAIPASIKPLDPTALAGTNVTFRCVLNTSATTQTAADIVWYYQSYNKMIPRERYEVEDNISRLRLHNVTFADSGAYYCALESDGRRIWQYEGSMLRVGEPPSPPSGLRCHCANMLDYWCEWSEGTRTNLRTSFKFSYRQRYGSGEWKDCPKMEARGDNTCFVSRHNNDGYQQIIRVSAVNALGTARSEINYNPSLATIPNAPTDVKVVTVNSEGLRVTWGLPDEWDETYVPSFLEYRLQVTTHGGKVVTRMIPDVSHGEPYINLRLYNVDDLLAHTKYNVRVSTRTLVAGRDDLWSDWTEPVAGRTAEAEPSAAVTDIHGQEYDNTVDPAHQRDIFLHWNELHHADRRGRILGYEVELRMVLADGSSELVRRLGANGTMVLIEKLDKFNEYYVDISAFNSAGNGPIASYFLADKTSEPGPPEHVRVQNTSETTALVTWQQPVRPNGYIKSYYVEWTKGALGDAASSFIEVNGSRTSYTIQGLEPDRLYQFRVKARNSRGYSGWSNAPIQHMGGGSRIELLRTLITVLHNLLMDMGDDGDNGNQITLDTIPSFL